MAGPAPRSDPRAGRNRTERKPPGRIRLAYRRWSSRLLELAGDPRWGIPIVFVSGATGVPPILALQFIIPPTKMPAWLFALALFVGRSLLFLAISFGADALFDRLLG